MTSFLKYQVEFCIFHIKLYFEKIMAPKRKVEELESRGIMTNTPDKMVVPGEETSGIVKYIQVDSI